MRRTSYFLLAMLAALVGCQQTDATPPGQTTIEWSPAELNQIFRLSLASLPVLGADPGNAFADDFGAARLGQQIFFDTRFSASGDLACATCHQPDKYFTDGLAVPTNGQRNTQSLVGVAYNRWFFWDGRRDSLWAQAISPLEAGHEQNLARTEIAHLVGRYYPAEYEALFGALPNLADEGRFPEAAGPTGSDEARRAWQAMSAADQTAVNRVVANVGKALAAYERLLLPGQSRFDEFALALRAGDRTRADAVLTAEEQTGLRLFIGEAHCTNCHGGPLFNDPFFHNVGPPDAGLDPGRAAGAASAAADLFNCLGPFSDAPPDRCRAINEIQVEGAGLQGAFKTPSLRNVALTAPYMHHGRLATLIEVLDHYNSAPAAEVGRSEIQPLNLTAEQRRQIVLFLEALTGPIASQPAWLSAP